jgi:hypothetical protein
VNDFAEEYRRQLEEAEPLRRAQLWAQSAGLIMFALLYLVVVFR